MHGQSLGCSQTLRIIHVSGNVSRISKKVNTISNNDLFLSFYDENQPGNFINSLILSRLVNKNPIIWLMNYKSRDHFALEVAANTQKVSFILSF